MTNIRATKTPMPTPKAVDRELPHLARGLYGGEKGKTRSLTARSNMNLAGSIRPNCKTARTPQRLATAHGPATVERAPRCFDATRAAKAFGARPRRSTYASRALDVAGSEQLPEGSLRNNWPVTRNLPSALGVARLTGERRLASETCLARLKLWLPTPLNRRLARPRGAPIRLRFSDVNTPVPLSFPVRKPATFWKLSSNPPPNLMTRSCLPDFGWPPSRASPAIPGPLWIGHRERRGHAAVERAAFEKKPCAASATRQPGARAEQINARRPVSSACRRQNRVGARRPRWFDRRSKGKGAPPTIDFTSLLEKLAADPASPKKPAVSPPFGRHPRHRNPDRKDERPSSYRRNQTKAIRAAPRAGTGRAREALLRLSPARRTTACHRAHPRAREIGGDTVATTRSNAGQTSRRRPPRRRRSVGLAPELGPDLPRRRGEQASFAQRTFRPRRFGRWRQNSDVSIRERAAKAIGRFRASDADKLKLIAGKRKVVLAAQPDITPATKLPESLFRLPQDAR